MNFNENPALYTMLQRAVRAGRAAVSVLQGDVSVIDPYDYPGDEAEFAVSDTVAPWDHDECLCDFRLVPKRERGSLRMNLRTPVKPRVPSFNEAMQQFALQRQAVDQFCDEYLDVQRNLRVYCRTLGRDVDQAWTRCFEADVFSREFLDDEWQRVQRLVDFLVELMSQEQIDKRLGLLSAARSGWVALRQPFGLSLDELENAIMAADCATFA